MAPNEKDTTEGSGAFSAAALTADDADRLASRFRASWDDAEWSDPGMPPAADAPKPSAAAKVSKEPRPPVRAPEPSGRAGDEPEEIAIPTKSSRAVIATLVAVLGGLGLMVGAFAMRGLPDGDALERRPPPAEVTAAVRPSEPVAAAPTPTPIETRIVPAVVADPTPALPTETPVVEAPPPAPEPVRLQLDVTPASATILANGSPLATPMMLVGLPGTAVQVRVAAEGYVTSEQSVIFAEDGPLTFRLERVPEPPPPVREPRPTPPAETPRRPRETPTMTRPVMAPPVGGFVTENPY